MATPLHIRVLALARRSHLARSPPSASRRAIAPAPSPRRPRATTHASPTAQHRRRQGNADDRDQSPANGATVSGTIAWEVAVSAGAPSKVEFAVDGATKWLDTTRALHLRRTAASTPTKLSNGSHTLSATAYGSRGVQGDDEGDRARVANRTDARPEPRARTDPEPEPTPEPRRPRHAGTDPAPADRAARSTGAPDDRLAPDRQPGPLGHERGRQVRGKRRQEGSRWSSSSSPSPTATLALLLLQLPDRRRWNSIRQPRRDPGPQLELAVDPLGQPQRARLPALRRDRGPLRRLHPRLRHRGQGLGPPLLPPLQLGDERQLVPLVGGRQRQPAGRVRRRLAPRARHLHRGRRDQRRPGSGARTSTTTATSRARRALPGRRLRRLDLPRRLQLGHQPGQARTAGRASTSSTGSTYANIVETIAPRSR